MTRLPQALINVKDVDRARATIDRGVTDAIAAAERELGETGRVLLRPSGTEPVVRVMVEAPHDDQATEIAERLAGVVRERVGRRATVPPPLGAAVPQTLRSSTFCTRC